MPFETTFKKNPFSSVNFYIDELVVRIDGTEIPIQNISGFSYYVEQSRRMTMNTGKLFVVFIYEKNKPKPHKLVGMYAFDGGSGNENFSDVFRYLWVYIGDKQLEELHAKLLKGEEVLLNEYLLLTQKGVYTSLPGLFRMRKFKNFTYWNELQTLLPSEVVYTATGIDYFKVINHTTNKTVGKYHIGWNNMRLFDSYVNWLNENPDELERLNAH